MSDSFTIVPTVVPKDAEDFARTVAVAKVFSDRIHLDIDDGVFAGAPTWPFLPSGEFLPFDLATLGIRVEAHLMTKDPRATGDALAAAGASLVIAHIEAFAGAAEAIAALESWRASGAQAGIAILMQTPLEALEPVIASCDVVQSMCIDTVGAQGAMFDPRSLARIAQLHAKFPQTLIAADGGISKLNIADLARAGARSFCVGTAIMKQENPAVAYAALTAQLTGALK